MKYKIVKQAGFLREKLIFEVFLYGRGVKIYSFIILLFLFPAHLSIGQNTNLIRTNDFEFLLIPTDSLLSGINQTEDLSESAFLYALSYFPELNPARIVLREKSIKTTMNVRPTLASVMFRKKSNRSYIIRINNTNRIDKVTAEKIPHVALIGLYGHELCHIIDYRNKNALQIIFTGLSYSTKKGKIKLEKSIDTMVVDRGLGWQLHQWTEFIINNPIESESYKNFKKTIYLQPDDILNLLFLSVE